MYASLIEVIRFLFVLLVVGVFSQVAIAEAKRVWKNQEGKKIEASVLTVEMEHIHLRKSGGGVFKVPIQSLSDEDQKYIESIRHSFLPRWRGWPKQVRMTLGEIKVKEHVLKDDEFSYLYETEHYQLFSQIELSQQVMLDVARIFELSYELMEVSPWGLLVDERKEKFRVELYKSASGYYRAGGPVKSAGVYFTKEKKFMVPAFALGLKQSSSGYRRDENYSLKVVMHELVHMLTDKILVGTPNYITEGLAEYLSMIPYRGGVFYTENVKAELKKHFANISIENIPNVIHTPNADWKRLLSGQASESGLGLSDIYDSSLAIVCYFVHVDGNGDLKKFRQYMKYAESKSGYLRIYLNQYEKYKEEIDDFIAENGINVSADGSFSYREGLIPPQPPRMMEGVDTIEGFERLGSNILFGEQKEDEFINRIGSELRQYLKK